MLSADNLNAVAYAYKYLGIPFERQQARSESLAFCVRTL